MPAREHTTKYASIVSGNPYNESEAAKAAHAIFLITQRDYGNEAAVHLDCAGPKRVRTEWPRVGHMLGEALDAGVVNCACGFRASPASMDAEDHITAGSSCVTPPFG